MRDGPVPCSHGISENHATPGLSRCSVLLNSEARHLTTARLAKPEILVLWKTSKSRERCLPGVLDRYPLTAHTNCIWSLISQYHTGHDTYYYSILPLQPPKQNFVIWLGKPAWSSKKRAENQHQRRHIVHPFVCSFWSSPGNVSGRQVISCMLPLWCHSVSVTPSAPPKCQVWAEEAVVTLGLKQATLTMKGNIFYGRTTLWNANSKDTASSSIDIDLCRGQWQSHLSVWWEQFLISSWFTFAEH